MKTTITIPAGGMATVAREGAACNVTACHNLRPVRLPSGAIVLKPVGAPVVLSDDSLKPLELISADGRTQIVAAKAERLHLIDPTPAEVALSDTTASDGYPLPGEALCAVADGADLTVMTGAGQLRLKLDTANGTFSAYDPADIGATIVMTAETLADITATTGERLLSADYPAGNHSLADRDLRAVSADMRRAYTEVCRQAAADGSFVAPMLCRWRAVSGDGHIIAESPLMLLGPADGSRLTAPVTLRSTDRRTIEAWEYSLPSWRPKITVRGTLSSRVDRIEVVAAPPFHPFDSTETAAVTIVSASTGDEFLRVGMPGAWKSVSSGNSRCGCARLRRMIGVFAGNCELIATLRRGDSATVVTGHSDSLSAQCRRTEKALGTAVAAADPELNRISPPHSFTAGCGASAAGYELWGRLRAIRFGGYPAEIFAASTAGTGGWHAAVSVDFADGDRIVKVSEGTAGAPLTFNPLLSYPSPDAVSMTLTVSCGGEVRRGSFALTPDASGRMAVYIDDSLEPFALPETLPAFAVPSERRAEQPIDGCVCVCRTPRSGAVRRPEAIASVSDGRIAAIWPEARISAGWDSADQRFTLFSAAGIHRVKVSGRNDMLNLKINLISSEAINGDNAVAMVGSRLVAAVGRRLAAIGSGSVKTYAEDIEADTLAWSEPTGELWTARNGSVTVLDTGRMETYTRDEPELSSPAGRYALLGGRLCDLSRETPAAGQIYVRWAAAADFGGYRRLRQLSLDLGAEAVANGSLSLRRTAHERTETAATCRANISGKLRAPLCLRGLSLPARGCEADFQARVVSGACVSSFKIATE